MQVYSTSPTRCGGASCPRSRPGSVAAHPIMKTGSANNRLRSGVDALSPAGFDHVEEFGRAQIVDQQVACAVDAAFDGANGAIADPGGLFIAFT